MTSVPQLERVVADAVRDEADVAAAFLFGSVARNQATELSDNDLALVVSEKRTERERGELIRRVLVKLGRAMPGETFEVRLLDELPIAVAGRAVTEGVLVFERDAAARVRAEVAVRMQYYDWVWFERASNREGIEGLRRRLERG